MSTTTKSLLNSTALKKILTASLTLALTAAVAGCGGAPAKSAAAPEPPAKTETAATSTAAIPTGLQGKKVLIAYYSYSNNTRIVAQMLQAKVGGDLFAIEPATPYSTTDYRGVSAQGQREVRNGYKPALKNKVTNIAAYDVVVLGSPIWWGTIAPPVATFLAEHDLAGKTIVPYVTHGGYGAGTSFEDIASQAPQTKVLTGLSLDRRSVPGATFLDANGQNVPPAAAELQKYPAAATEIDNWLSKLKF